jgi:cytochrome c oxidase subunit 2
MKSAKPILWRRGALAFAVIALVSCGLTPSRGDPDGDDDDAEYASAKPAEHVVHVTARRFEYEPSTIHVKRGEPVVLVLSSADVPHGFEAPRLALATTITPGKESRLSFTPKEAGRFPFHCSVFCGDGHEDMEGEIDVDE